MRKSIEFIKKILHVPLNARFPADTPLQLPASQWRYVFVQVAKNIIIKNTPLLAASIAYFATLSFFPLVIAGVAITTFIMNDSQLQSAIASIQQYLPQDMAGLLSAQFENALHNKSNNILTALVALVIAIFGVSAAVQNLIHATNLVYDTKETRGFIGFTAMGLVLTLAMLAGVCIILVLIVLNQDILQTIHTPAAIATIFPYIRWPLLVCCIMFGLAVFYRYGPSRRNPKWRWVSWGAAAATIIWLLGTYGFFIYIQYFGNLGSTYSVFAGSIALMLWFNLTAFIVLLGAQINHNLELRTTKPTES